MLEPWRRSNRGFRAARGLDLENRTYTLIESSLATEPAIRIHIGEEGVHLNLRDAHDLAVRIIELCLTHYQVDAFGDNAGDDDE